MTIRAQQTSRVRSCPWCDGTRFHGKEYLKGSPEAYDGVSEWICDSCATRVGRWSGKVLAAGEIEKRYGG